MTQRSHSLRPAGRRLAQQLGALMLATGLSFAVQADTVYPAKMSADDLTGAMLERPETEVTDAPGGQIRDITSLKSSNGRFASGMYSAPASRFDISEPYGVDEFMYFLEGGVTLTSLDGTVTHIGAGEAVTIPKEWRGIWETEGYRKIWVIYSEDGSGL